MASISNNQIKLGLATRLASDWDTTTAADLATASGAYLVHNASFDDSAQSAEYVPQTVGLGSFKPVVYKTTTDVSFSLQGDLFFGSQIFAAIAAFLGTVDAPSAVLTSGQGDRRHYLQMASTSSGSSSIAWTIASDEVKEIPNVDWQAVSITFPNAGAPQCSLEGIGDALVPDDDANNTYAEVNGLSFPTTTPEVGLWGAGASCSGYIRLAPYSASVALSGANNIEVLSAGISISRNLAPRYVQRQCNSTRSQKPRQTGYCPGQLTFQLGEHDSSALDLMNLWADGTPLMAEIAVFGDRIGTGNYRTMKFYIPYCQIVQAPVGLSNAGGIEGLIEPQITLEMMKAPADAAGMPAGTEFFCIELIDARGVSYFPNV